MDKKQLARIFHSMSDYRRTQPDYTLLARFIADKQIAVEEVDLTVNVEVQRFTELKKREKELSKIAFDLNTFTIDREAQAVLYDVRDELRRYNVGIRGSSWHNSLGSFGYAYLVSQDKKVLIEQYYGGVYADLISSDCEILVECGNTNGYYMLAHFTCGFEAEGVPGKVEQYCIIPFSADVPPLYRFTRGGNYDNEYIRDLAMRRAWES